MSRVARDIGLCVAYGASLPLIPRDIKIPDHYWISTHVQQMLVELAAAPPADPAKLTHVTWLCSEFIRHYTVLLKYALIEPLIAFAYMIEWLWRSYFTPVNQMSEQNLQELQASNHVFGTQLESLRDQTNQDLKQGDSAIGQCIQLVSILEKYNTQLVKDTVRTQQHAEELTRASLALEKLFDQLTVEETELLQLLGETKIHRSLKTYLTRSEAIRKAHLEATERLQSARAQHSAEVDRAAALQRLQYEFNAAIVQTGRGLLKATQITGQAQDNKAVPSPKIESLHSLSKKCAGAFERVRMIFNLVAITS
jgi:hypothetical protein